MPGDDGGAPLNSAEAGQLVQELERLMRHLELADRAGDPAQPHPRVETGAIRRQLGAALQAIRRSRLLPMNPLEGRVLAWSRHGETIGLSDMAGEQLAVLRWEHISSHHEAGWVAYDRINGHKEPLVIGNVTADAARKLMLGWLARPPYEHVILHWRDAAETSLFLQGRRLGGVVAHWRAMRDEADIMRHEEDHHTVRVALASGQDLVLPWTFETEGEAWAALYEVVEKGQLPVMDIL